MAKKQLMQNGKILKASQLRAARKKAKAGDKIVRHSDPSYQISRGAAKHKAASAKRARDGI